MQLTPRYSDSGPPVIDVAAVVGDPFTPLVRQGARLVHELADLSVEQWLTPSRCAGWTVQDVAEHLAGVNAFWALTVEAGLRDEPTRFLANFDPVAVPAALVDAARGSPPSATLDRLTTSTAALASLLSALADTDWSKLAEAPPGHITIGALAAHALWDSWIHERDVLLPLSLPPVVEPDEVVMALAYVAALGPALQCAAGSTAKGSLGVVGHDPEVRLTVDVGTEVAVRPGLASSVTATIEGSAVELLEALSLRMPMPSAPASALPDESRWLLGGLDEAFAT